MNRTTAPTAEAKALMELGYYRRFDQSCRQLNNQLSTSILTLPDDRIARKDHFFNGRYENIYPRQGSIEAIAPIIQTALSIGARCLNMPPDGVKIGYWINLMHRHDVTLRHCHDDHNELLSGTYYIQTPTGSGALWLHGKAPVCILANEGWFVFFSPSLDHEVSSHDSDIPRISIGFNIGPRDE